MNRSRARAPTPASLPLASWAAASSSGEDRYRLLAGATHDVLWDWDLMTGHVERNDALSTTFGYAPGDIAPTREWWNERMHPDDRCVAEELIAAALERRGAFTLEYRFRRADGTYANILDRAWIMRDARGQAVRAVGSCVDVSDRKALEFDLRRKTERLAGMMEMQRELATTTSGIAGALGRVAARAAQIAHADGAAIGRVDEDSLVYGEGFGVGFAQDGDRLPIADSFADEVLRTREPLVVWDVLHDARIRPDSVRASGVRSLVALPLVAESRVLGLLSVHGSTPRVFDSEEVQALSVVAGFIAVAFADAERFEENHYLLAERTAALAAARESEERYRTVTDEAPLRIAVIDAEQRYQFVNQTISVAHRRPASEILGRRLDEIIIPVNYARLKPYVLAALAGREQSFDAAWDIPGESSRILATRYVPRRDESGAVTGFYVISSDETDHRRLQEQVQRTQRMEAVGQLAGGIAHDFNNLLTVIGGFAQVLGADSRLADDQREDVEEIVKATRRAGDLTRRLLAFSRKQTLQPSLVDLNTVIIDNERMLRRLVREDIEYITDLEPGLGQVFADLRQLEHVLVNLIVNARDAMPQEGRITIETRELDVSAGTSGDMPAGQWVRLRVVDTGAGMTPEVLEHVFEPFFTTKPAGEGTGLGLAMVYGIVEQSGGVIRAESTPGTGTVFTILLPRAAPSAPPRHTPATVQAVSATGELILLVEDEEPVRMLAVRLLKRAGYEVVTARNGREAAEIIDREPRNIQLVVSDIVMPEMGGIELGHYVRFRRPATRLLFISGYAAAEIERRGGLPADAGFLQKPFSSNALANAVRDALTVDV